MASPRTLLIPALVVAAGLFGAYVILVGRPEPSPLPAVPPVAPVVHVVRSQPSTIALPVSTQGTVRPHREIQIVSQVAGRVETVAPEFAGGGFFAAGRELIKVEDSDYRFAIVRAEARVADAAQLVALEKGRVRQASREWRDLGNAEANQLFLRKPQLASAEAAWRAAQADLGQAELDLQRTSVSVPFAGRVSEKHVDAGQYISPGTVLAKVYDTDVVEIRLPLTDRQVALLDLPLDYAGHALSAEEGTGVVLSARFADREWQWQGQIVRTDASIDVDSRVVYAVVEVLQPYARKEGSDRPPLGIGLFVSAEISGRRIDAVSTLPRSALRKDGAVMVVDADDRLQSRPVRVLKSSIGQVWVQGLAANERVVVSQLSLAIVGMQVTVADTTELADGRTL